MSIIVRVLFSSVCVCVCVCAPPPKTPLLHPPPLSPMAPPPGNMGGGPIQQLGFAASFARVGSLGRLEWRLACTGLSPPVNIPPGSPMFR